MAGRATTRAGLTALRRSLWCGAAAAILALGSPGCEFVRNLWSEPAPPEPQRRPNVILISIDTLRPDHLSGYGYGRRTSPTIDALMSEGVTFTNAWAPSSWTLPSMASLMTGLYPSRHGVEHSLEGKAPLPTEGEAAHERFNTAVAVIAKQDILEESFVTLAEALHAGGYATFGLTSNVLMQRPFGFAQGFDRYDDRKYYRSAQDMFAALTEWSEAIHSPAKAAPFFVWVHLFDPHLPYTSHDPYVSTWDPGYDGPPLDLMRPTTGPLVYDLPQEPAALARALRHLKAQYDSEILHTDTYIGRILDFLQFDVARDVLVIVSDHGEEFLEHGDLGHGRHLFPEVVRIPFLIVAPGLPRGTRVDTPASLLDVYPTLMDAVGVGVAPHLDGVSQFAALNTGLPRRAVGERVLFGKMVTMRNFASVYDGSQLYLHNQTQDQQYLLAIGPDFTQTVLNPNAAAADMARLQALLDAHLQGARRTAPPVAEFNIDPELKEQMEAFGYLH